MLEILYKVYYNKFSYILVFTEIAYMAKFKCIVCGKLFDRVGNGVYCQGPHYRPCPVCGKPVAFRRPKEPIRCCSKECVNKMALESKRKNLGMRKCEICGKMYQPNDVSQKYCSGSHETKCVICGKSIIYTCHPSDKPNTCSEQCKEELRMRTNVERWGYRNPAYSESVRKKISASNISGSVGAVKRASTLSSMYGDGVVNPFQIPSVIAHNKKLLHDPEFLAHRYDEYKKKTGYDSPGSNPETHRKRLETRAEHGPYESFSRAIITHNMLDSSKVDNFLAFKEDPKNYILKHYSHKPTIDELRTDLGVTDTPIYEILNTWNITNLTDRTRSCVELTIQHFIESLGVVVDPDNRDIIKPKEIDLWMPEYSIGVEYDPTFTHNSTVGAFGGDRPKSPSYHKHKSDAVREQGAFLFHIFGYEWVNSKQIIKSMLRNLFGKNSESIGARKLHVDVVPYEDACIFLNTNHLQGSVSAKVFLGLYSDSSELISIMTFNRMRSTVGKTSDCDDSVWELSRFCNKLNTSVPGGASKLLKHFIDMYHPKKIISFSDDAHARGNLYDKLGFTKIHTTAPRYVWVDRYDKLVYNRVACQKNKLRKLLSDPDIDIEHKTEVEIMTDHGFLQVFNSGVTKWEMTL